MKVKLKKKLSCSKPTVRELGAGIIEITHHQTLKQSIGYQSMDLGYGVRFNTTKDQINTAFEFAEETVENLLEAKFNQQQELLVMLAKKHGKL